MCIGAWILISALDEGQWTASRSGSVTPEGTASGTCCVGGCVGPRVCLYVMKKRKNLLLLLGIEPPFLSRPVSRVDAIQALMTHGCVVRAVTTKSTIFWYVTPCSLVQIH
jgi:hypothetical protein